MKTAFIIPGKAKPKGRPRCGKRGRRIFAYTPQDTLEAEAFVADHVVVPEGWPLDQDYVVAIAFYHETNVYGDLDNLAKLVLDALNTGGEVWEDDKQVSQLLLARYFDTENPRTEVFIRTVPPQRAQKRVRKK